jgi:ribosomal protein L37AE/L43A
MSYFPEEHNKLALLTSMSDCPCCSHRLLRHVCKTDVYWFCSHCHQAMPSLTVTKQASWGQTKQKLPLQIS